MRELGNRNLKLIYRDAIGNSFYAKDESINPSGSIKDIPVYYILSDYKVQGLLSEDVKIIEPTSGNTGISLAYFQQEFGYHAIIVLPKSASEERKEMIRYYGAEVIEVNGGMKECQERVDQLLTEYPGSLSLHQFSNPINALSHEQVTGPQIHEALPQVDYIVAGVGTSGTFTGIARFFKKITINSRLIAVEPAESRLLAKGVSNPHHVEGIGANFIPELFDQSLVGDYESCNYENAVKTAKELHKLGFNVGVSSGAAMYAAMHHAAQHLNRNKTYVIIFPDKGDRYSW